MREWLAHPVSLLLRRWCSQQVETAKDNWVRGRYITQSEHDKAIGNATAFGEILDMDIDTLNGALDNGE